MSLRRYGLIAQSLFYLISGVNHFWHSGTYRPLMPGHYSNPDLMIYLSGAAELLGGTGLLAPIPKIQRAAALGVMATLVVFLDVHLFMIGHADRFPGIPVWLLWARLPMQGLLIAWAWTYFRKPEQLYRSRNTTALDRNA